MKEITLDFKRGLLISKKQVKDTQVHQNDSSVKNCCERFYQEVKRESNKTSLAEVGRETLQVLERKLATDVFKELRTSAETLVGIMKNIKNINLLKENL